MGCAGEAVENKEASASRRAGLVLKNIRERRPIRSWRRARVRMRHPGLFWRIIRLLLGLQPPQTKTQRRGGSSSLQGGGSLRRAAIGRVLFVLN